VEVAPTSVTIPFAKEAGPGRSEIVLTGRVRTLAPETLAGTVIRGAYYVLGDSLRVQAEIGAETQGRILEAVQATGHVDDLMEVAGKVTGLVMTSLARRFDPRLVEEGLGSLLEGDFPRYEAYAALMDAMDAKFGGRGLDEVMRHAGRAIELDSTLCSSFVLATFVHVSRGQGRQADSILEFLQPHRERLNGFELLNLDIMRARLHGDLQEEFLLSREWTDTYGELGQGLWQHGWAALRVNRPQEALAALGRVGEALEEIEYLLTLFTGSPTSYFRDLVRELQAHGHMEAAQEILEISRPRLARLMEKYGVE